MRPKLSAQAMSSVHGRRSSQPLQLGHFASLLSLLLSLLFSACTSVDTILLTSERFPPKASADEVTVLEQKPSRSHLEIAELRAGDSRLSFGSLQHKILTRAAELGADAVVFARPQTQTIQHVAYEPLYDQWDANNPYDGSPWGYGWYGGSYGGWGLWGGGYSGMIEVPYDEIVKMLMGTAIRYTDVRDLGDQTKPGGR